MDSLMTSCVNAFCCFEFEFDFCLFFFLFLFFFFVKFQVKLNEPFIRAFWSRALIGTRWLTKDRESTAICVSLTACGFNANPTTTTPRARNSAGRGTTCSATTNATATAIRPACRDGLVPPAKQVGFKFFFFFWLFRETIAFLFPLK